MITCDYIRNDLRIINWQSRRYTASTVLDLSLGHEHFGGGIRLLPYSAEQNVDELATKLARKMSLKSKYINLPFSGAKTVIIGTPQHEKDRDGLLQAISELLIFLDGKYFIGGDLNFTQSDVNAVHKLLVDQPPHIQKSALNSDNGAIAEATAHGLHGVINTFTKHAIKHKTLNEIRVLIQGIGSVGYNLGKLLIESGAQVYVNDLDSDKTSNICSQYSNVTIVSKNDFKELQPDIFVPLATSYNVSLNDIKSMRPSNIIPGANLPFVEAEYNEIMEYIEDAGIGFIPDHLCNLGGVYFAALNYFDHDARIDKVKKYLEKITEENLFKKSLNTQYDDDNMHYFYKWIMGGGSQSIHYGVYDEPNLNQHDAIYKTKAMILDAVKNNLPSNPNVIELGSGLGGSSEFILSKIADSHLTAINICEGQNKTNQKNINEKGYADRFTLETTDFDNLSPSLHGLYDLAWSQEAFCHSYDLKKALLGVYSCLKPGGMLVFTDLLFKKETKISSFEMTNVIKNKLTKAQYDAIALELGWMNIEYIDLSIHLEENFRQMRDRLEKYYDQLISHGVSEKRISEYQISLDKRLDGSDHNLAWGVFVWKKT